MAKECTISTGKLPPGGLSRNIVVRITDPPHMTLAVYRGRKALNKTNEKSYTVLVEKRTGGSFYRADHVTAKMSRVKRKSVVVFCICEKQRRTFVLLLA